MHSEIYIAERRVNYAIKSMYMILAIWVQGTWCCVVDHPPLSHLAKQYWVEAPVCISSCSLLLLVSV